MAKPVKSNSSKASSWVQKSSTEFKLRNESLWCRLCNVAINCTKSYIVERHIASQKHRELLSKVEIIRNPDSEIEEQDFASKVTKAFLASDIPLYKVNNPELQDLFRTMGQALPSESCCRSRVSTLAENRVKEIKEKIFGKEVFLVVDETDIRGKKVVL